MEKLRFQADDFNFQANEIDKNLLKFQLETEQNIEIEKHILDK